MPLVKIHVLEGLNDEQKNTLHKAIHSALVESLEIPDWDFFHRIYEFSRTDFVFPDTKSDKFIILEIHLYPGRTKETKKKMYAKLCDNLEAAGIPGQDIIIQIIEQPLYNWGIMGGLPADEAGLKIKS